MRILSPEAYAAHQAKFGRRQIGKAARVVDAPQKAGKRSKHGAVKTAIDGERFDSKLEARIWASLKLREKTGSIKGLRRQVRFSLFAHGGEHIGTWRADFVWLEPSVGTDAWQRIVADAKSTHTLKLPGWNRTKAIMLACHGIEVMELGK